MIGAFINFSFVLDNHEQLQGCLVIFGLPCLGVFFNCASVQANSLQKLIFSNCFWMWLRRSLGVFRFVEALASVACVLATCLQLTILVEISTNMQLVRPQCLVVFFCLIVMVLIPNSL